MFSDENVEDMTQNELLIIAVTKIIIVATIRMMIINW